MLHSNGRIVVTGGAGFIGSHLVDRLLQNGAGEVIVLDNLQRGRLDNLARHASDPRLRVVQGDVRDYHTVRPTMHGAETVYHLAAQATVMGAMEDLSYSFSTNVLGTFNVLRAAAEAKVGCTVFASSREVYGDPVDLPVKEDQPLLAINYYGASKVMGEAYCRAFARATGLHSVVLRLANVYGPRDTGRVIPLWLDEATDRRPLTIFGGRQVIDFVWIDYVVEALLRAAEIAGPLPPINVGSGTGTRIIDLARRIIRLFGRHSQIHIRPARSVDVGRFVADVNRMRQMLGIEPPNDPLAQLDALAGRIPTAATV